jgi:hypothetical protein
MDTEMRRDYTRTRQQIAEEVFHAKYGDTEWGRSGTSDDGSWRRAEAECVRVADRILAIPGIYIRASNQWPPFPPVLRRLPEAGAYEEGRKDMIELGFVRCVPKHVYLTMPPRSGD